MSSVVISGDTSGAITLSAPAVAGTNTITLPAATGTVVLTGTTPTLNGITFPATQVPSADANTLDDYEEGTWTPTISGATGSIGSQTYSTQAGRYVKIGRLVVLTGYLTLSNKGSWTGSVLIGGFPFVVNSEQASYSAHSFYGQSFNLPASSYGVGAYVNVGLTTASMYTNDNTSGVNLNSYATQLNNSTQVGPFQFCYYASA